MVCGWQAGGRWIPGEAWESLVPQESSGAEVQEQDLGRRRQHGASQVGPAQTQGPQPGQPCGSCAPKATRMSRQGPSCAPSAS